MEFHPAANEFPLMDAKRLEELAADISRNGQKLPIVLAEGKVLDGRNRWLACEQIKREPITVEFAGGDPWAYVWSLNGSRRDIEPNQRYLIWDHVMEQSEAWRIKQAEIAAAANVKRSEAAKGMPYASKGGTRKPEAEKVDVQNVHAPSVAPARKAKAEASLTGVGTVARMDALKAARPDLAAEVRLGTVKATDAQKQARKEKREDKEKDAKKKAKANTWLVTDDTSIVKCQALITDPPYGILNESWEPTQLESFTREWAAEWNECGADLAAIFFSQRWMWDARKWFDEALSRYTFQQLLVWHYANNKSPQSRMGFKQTWEPIFLYRLNGSKKQIQLHGGDWGEGLNDFDCHVAAVPQSNFNDANSKVHPAQKPVSAMEWLVNAMTVPGDMVADPFCGSGTTGIAAVKMLRRFHGIDTKAEYVELSKTRIAAYGEQL